MKSIKEILNYSNGVFIEAGANDGVSSSNTLILERELNWKGILIEPSTNKYLECVNNRKNSIVINKALTSDDSIKHIEGDFDGNLMSSVNGNRLKRNNLCKVESCTLNAILKEHNPNNKTIDYMSLDLEGYELVALQGIDFDKYKFNYIQIEINYTSYLFSDILKLLEQQYILFDNITKYNRTDNPGWDTTHNDYLFIRKEII